MQQPFKNKNQYAFSLMELVIVMAIVSIIALITFAGFTKMRNDLTQDAVIDDILVLTNSTRNDAVAGKNGASYSVYFDTDKVVSYEGTTYVSGDLDNKVVDMPVGFYLVTECSVTDNDQMTFETITGYGDNSCDVELHSYSVTEKLATIEIRRLGTISVIK